MDCIEFNITLRPSYPRSFAEALGKTILFWLVCTVRRIERSGCSLLVDRFLQQGSGLNRGSMPLDEAADSEDG